MYLDTSTLKKSGFRHINFENFGEISKSHLFVLQVDSSKPELVLDNPVLLVQRQHSLIQFVPAVSHTGTRMSAHCNRERLS